MPVYNAAFYLEDCLNSILAQSFKDWELIAVDDFSTDDTAKLLQEHSKKDPRIHCLQNTTKGIISALRNAYASSKGQYIHRMDADDLMPEQKLDLMFAEIEKHGRGHLITGLVEYFSASGIGDGYFNYQEWLNKLCIKNRHWDEIYKECVIASPCWMLPRDDLDACNAFNSDRYPEDYDLVFRFYKQDLKVISVPQVLHLWRDHPERSSRTQEHYQENTFYEIKTHYFMELDYQPGKTLIIWGAGKKGKLLARILKKRGVNFQWVSNNPNKEGKAIYGALMEDYTQIVHKNHPQILITVAQKEAKEEIMQFMQSNQLVENEDFYFFS